MSTVLLEQYIREILTETPQLPQRFYHGSSQELEPGFILGGKAFKSDFGSMEDILEHYRPKGMHSRLNSVYMTSRPSNIESAGGSEAYMYLVKPLDEVQAHHQGWISILYEFTQDKSDNYTKRGPIIYKKNLQAILDSKEAKPAAVGYWSGRRAPPDYPGVWEFLCGRAEVIKEVKIRYR